MSKWWLPLAAALAVALPLGTPQGEETKQAPANEQSAAPHEQSSSATVQAPAVSDSVNRAATENPGGGKQQQENWADKAWRHWARRFFTDLKVTDALIAIFTGLLALFTARLWTATAKLWRTSQEHAGHAENLIEVTKRLQRAFIAVEPGGIRPYGGDDDRIACDIRITNAGNMPASHVAWAIEREYSRDGYRKEFLIIKKSAGDIVIAPKSSATKGGDPTNKKDFDEYRVNAERDRAWLYVWGKVTYHDGFQPGRYIRFCHRYNLRGECGYAISVKRARYHEWGNHTDEA